MCPKHQTSKSVNQQIVTPICLLEKHYILKQSALEMFRNVTYYSKTHLGRPHLEGFPVCDVRII